MKPSLKPFLSSIGEDEVVIVASFSPEEKQTLEEPGCDASWILDQVVYTNRYVGHLPGPERIEEALKGNREVPDNVFTDELIKELVEECWDRYADDDQAAYDRSVDIKLKERMEGAA